MAAQNNNTSNRVTRVLLALVIFVLFVIAIYFLVKYLKRYSIMNSTSWDKLPFISKVTENQKEFGQKVIAISADMGIDPAWLMLVMNNESGVNSHIKNMAGGSATGLIQFTATTAKGLGTTTDSLAAMSNVEQLDWVKKYFEPYSGRINSAADLYLAVFYPEALWKGDDWQFPDWAVKENKIFFTQGNTKKDFINYVNKKYSQYV